VTDYFQLAEQYTTAPSRPAPSVIPLYRTIEDVEPEEVSWLSPGRIPRGKLTVVEGDPGLGKTWLLLDLAARLTRGTGFPGDPAIEPADTVVMTGEDGVADTIRPRLEAAGADLGRVHHLDGVRVDDEDAGISLPEHVPALRLVVEQRGAQLVVIDPLNAFLASQVDSYRDHDIRRALVPLAQLAEDTGAAVVIVRHLRKAGGARAIAAGGGSIGIGAASRSVLLVDEDPTDPERRVLASVKCNIARPPVSLSFRITSDTAPHIEWLGQSEQTAESLVAARMEREGDGSPKADEAADLLKSWLESGPMERREVLRLGRESGLSDRTLDRSARLLRVVKDQQGYGREKRSYWALPGNPATPSSNAAIDKNLGGIEDLGGNVELQGLRGPPSPLFSQSRQPSVYGAIGGNGRPIPPCELGHGPQRQRTDGQYRCPVCCPDNRWKDAG